MYIHIYTYILYIIFKSFSTLAHHCLPEMVDSNNFLELVLINVKTSIFVLIFLRCSDIFIVENL